MNKQSFLLLFRRVDVVNLRNKTVSATFVRRKFKELLILHNENTLIVLTEWSELP